MYRIRNNKASDLKDGRTAKFLGDKIGISNNHMLEILKGAKCSKPIATCLVKIRSEKAEIEDYFEEI